MIETWLSILLIIVLIFCIVLVAGASIVVWITIFEAISDIRKRKY